MHTMPAYNHFRISGQWDRRKGFEKQKVFKEDLKELTEVEWRTETGSWFQQLEPGKRKSADHWTYCGRVVL